MDPRHGTLNKQVDSFSINAEKRSSSQVWQWRDFLGAIKIDSISSDTMTRIQACLQDIAIWMSLNKLKLNGDKTELLVIGSCKLPVFQLPSFTVIDGSLIEPSHFARNIGVIFDNKLNMEHQVSSICKSAFFTSGIFRGLESFCQLIVLRR